MTYTVSFLAHERQNILNMAASMVRKDAIQRSAPITITQIHPIQPLESDTVDVTVAFLSPTPESAIPFQGQILYNSRQCCSARHTEWRSGLRLQKDSAPFNSSFRIFSANDGLTIPVD